MGILCVGPVGGVSYDKVWSGVDMDATACLYQTSCKESTGEAGVCNGIAANNILGGVGLARLIGTIDFLTSSGDLMTSKKNGS